MKLSLRLSRNSVPAVVNLVGTKKPRDEVLIPVLACQSGESVTESASVSAGLA